MVIDLLSCGLTIIHFLKMNFYSVQSVHRYFSFQREGESFTENILIIIFSTLVHYLITSLYVTHTRTSKKKSNLNSKNPKLSGRHLCVIYSVIIVLCHPSLNVWMVSNYAINRPDQRWPLPWKHALEKNSPHLFIFG